MKMKIYACVHLMGYLVHHLFFYVAYLKRATGFYNLKKKIKSTILILTGYFPEQASLKP